jgi:hypothetical protein
MQHRERETDRGRERRMSIRKGVRGKIKEN